MITPLLNSQDKKPLYEQLTQDIKEEIRSGRLAAGERLPSKRTLAAHLKVSRSTVEMAYDQLVSEGYIRARERSGYYVRQAERTFAIGRRTQRIVPEAEPETDMRYDLRTSGVDTEKFPFTVWARLMRDILSEQGRNCCRQGRSRASIS